MATVKMLVQVLDKGEFVVVSDSFQKYEFIGREVQGVSGKDENIFRFQATGRDAADMKAQFEGGQVNVADKLDMQVYLSGREWKKGDKVMYFVNMNVVSWQILPNIAQGNSSAEEKKKSMDVFNTSEENFNGPLPIDQTDDDLPF